jgi:DtxR family Mn-dependent transcriptional regulator
LASGLLGLLVLVAPGVGMVASFRRWRADRQKRRLEDALKHVLRMQLRGGEATVQTLGGALEIRRPQVMDLIETLERSQLAHCDAGRVVLTDQGHQLAMHILRAHRLWETHLAGETGMGLAEVHRFADRAEHRLSGEQLDALAAHLGHPRFDPHGDPIPDAHGQVPSQNRSTLSDWPIDQPGRVVHIEDEPAHAMRRILDAGLRVGHDVLIRSREDGDLHIETGTQVRVLSRMIASQVHVISSEQMTAGPADTLPLSKLRKGEHAEVVSIDDECRGLNRRRLLDLGITSGAKISLELANAGRATRAYRVRQTLIALRHQQAEQIFVRLIRHDEAGGRGVPESERVPA